jgi:FKBP-type peptidyl-prolyl cis-trans isomerase FkpA
MTSLVAAFPRFSKLMAVLPFALAGLLPAPEVSAQSPAPAALKKPVPQAQGASAAAPASAAAVASAATPAGAGAVVTTSSGLVFTLIKQGTGASPKASDTVKVHYRGTFMDGREFDSSYKRGAPAEFPLDRVIKCWTEGVQKLQVGGSARLTCPPTIAYGERGAGGTIPPNATLQFEVELLGINGR